MTTIVHASSGWSGGRSRPLPTCAQLSKATALNAAYRTIDPGKAHLPDLSTSAWREASMHADGQSRPER